MPIVDVIPLRETVRERYLNYALSVITSRALPDIRDGLKPVQRRILYAMYTNLRLTPDARFRKSATVVGDTMGKLHPHGDTAIYDAMVRMAQGWVMRHPLVEGHGNFGSIDGDNPAAMRYTEARLQPLAVTLLEEIKKQTVAFRPNYDGTLFEPVVLPSRVPNLLVNGASGIAVGMATNIPPHNLGEVIDACLYLIKSPNATLAKLAGLVPGPDFPTAGRILNTPEELQKIYETGEGAVDIRGEYRIETTNGKKVLVIESVPYGVNKSDLVEKIGEFIRNEKIPQLSDVRDESTDEVRVVMELKRGASPEAAMAYLFKHSPLQTRFHVNLTCLVPTDNPEVAAPEKVDLKRALQAFLDFRLEVVTKRLQFDLDQLEKRIHILRGFARIFDALDEAIKIIRASKDKADAAQRLMHRFKLDDVQADAILEIKLYRLAQMEMALILGELKEKERQAAELRKLLGSEEARWKLIASELRDIKKQFADERRTTIAGPDAHIEYTEEDYIIKEDVVVIVTRDGWVKRQRSYTDLNAIRIREGDEIGWVIGASTRATVAFFTNYGRAYTLRVDELPSTTGYGEPIQKFFDFSDKELVVGVVMYDERVLPRIAPLAEGANTDLFGDAETEAEGPFIVAITEAGMGVRLPIANFSDPSTKNGRTVMRATRTERVVSVQISAGDENVCVASKEGRVLIFPVRQIPVFKSVAKGVITMRLSKGDKVLGYELATGAREGLEVETNRGRREVVRTTKYEVSNRGNKGRDVIKRGHFARVVLAPVEMPVSSKE